MNFVRVDGNGVVVCAIVSNTAQPGFTEVSDDVYELVNPGYCTYIEGKLSTYSPPATVVPKIYSGVDAIDAISEDALKKGRWKDALRVVSANDVREVKSKLKRIADANGITVDQLMPGIPLGQ